MTLVILAACKVLLYVLLFINLFVFIDGIVSLFSDNLSHFEAIFEVLDAKKKNKTIDVIVCLCCIGYLSYSVILRIYSRSISRKAERLEAELAKLEEELDEICEQVDVE